jgi:dihydroorotase-like cyclic amidohydrolase
MSLIIRNVRLAYPSSDDRSRQTFYVKCKDGKVKKLGKDWSAGLKKVPPVSLDSEVVDGGGGLLLPSYVS